MNKAPKIYADWVKVFDILKSTISAIVALIICFPLSNFCEYAWIVFCINFCILCLAEKWYSIKPTPKIIGTNAKLASINVFIIP